MSRKSKISLPDTSNSQVVSISDVASSYELNNAKTLILKLEQTNVALGQTIDKLMKQLSDKEDEIAHLKSMLGSVTPVVGNAIVMEYTDEEIISKAQLERLKRTAETRELTLEEVKKFDLLVKNKRLATGDSTIVADYKKLPSDPKELIQIASQKIQEDPNE